LNLKIKIKFKFKLIKINFIKFLLFVFIIITNCNIGFAQSAEENTLKGINFIYNLEYDSATIIFNEIIKANPSDPSGYFFMAMIDWWRINLNRDQESLDENFVKKVEKVIEICDAEIDKNEFDDAAMFYKGGALGYRGLVHSLRDNWLKAAEDGREALNLLQNANDINKNNKDVIFGIGLYNYFAEYVPEAYPVVKPLMLIFPKGDKLKGLAQIKETSVNSKYAKTEAKFVLAYLNLIYEKNYTEAENYSKVLNQEYPNNPIFEKYLCNSYIGQGKWEESSIGWKNIINKIDSNKAGYVNDNLKREANYYEALSLTKLRRISEAENYIKAAEEITKKIDKDSEDAYTAFIYLLSGMLNDINGNKATAENYYEKVLGMKNFQNSHQEAEKFKKEGYK